MAEKRLCLIHSSTRLPDFVRSISISHVISIVANYWTKNLLIFSASHYIGNFSTTFTYHKHNHFLSTSSHNLKLLKRSYKILSSLHRSRLHSREAIIVNLREKSRRHEKEKLDLARPTLYTILHFRNHADRAFRVTIAGEGCERVQRTLVSELRRHSDP